jgi:hypothetical protein
MADNRIFPDNGYTCHVFELDFLQYGGVIVMKLIIRLETDEWIYEEHEVA